MSTDPSDPGSPNPACARMRRRAAVLLSAAMAASLAYAFIQLRFDTDQLQARARGPGKEPFRGKSSLGKGHFFRLLTRGHFQRSRFRAEVICLGRGH